MVVDTLKKSEIFSVLKDDEIKNIAGLFETLEFNNNDTIFNEGDTSEKFYILARGNVKILKHSIGGKDIILEIMSQGDVFGGVAVLDNKPYPASAQAMEPSVIIRIGRQNLFHIMEEYPVLKLEIVKYFSDKLRDAHDMLKNIATERVERRIGSLLLKLSEKVGVDEEGYRKIDFPLTRQEISEMVGTTVETCIRTISKFQKQGMVKSSDGRILINHKAMKEYFGD